jgi:glycosyltransferase involved in cell wall biosynthesis
MTYLLDVCVPTYNRARLLKALLNDLHYQTKNERRVVVHVLDDASTDETCSIAKQYAAGDHFHYTRHETNIGGRANVPLAMETGDGEYVWIPSDHQRLIAGALPNLLDYLEVYRPDIVYCGIEQYGALGLLDEDEPLPIAEIPSAKLHELVFTTSNQAGLLVRRDAILAAADIIAEYGLLAYAHLGVWRPLLFWPKATLGAIPRVSRFNTHILHAPERYTWFRSGVLCFGALVDDLGAHSPTSGLSASRMLNVKLFRNQIIKTLLEAVCGLRRERISIEMLSEFGARYGWQAGLIAKLARLLLILPLKTRLVVRRILLTANNVVRYRASLLSEIVTLPTRLHEDREVAGLIQEQQPPQDF